MPRMKATKQAELETFWRAHLAGWRQSSLNQREYCEAHGLPLNCAGGKIISGADDLSPSALCRRMIS